MGVPTSQQKKMLYAGDKLLLLQQQPQRSFFPPDADASVAMKPRPFTLGGRRTLRAFAIELTLYGLLVTGYFFGVLHFLGNWLVQLETQHIRIYASVAILLIIGQAVMLEAVTTGLLRLLRRGRSE